VAKERKPEDANSRGNHRRDGGVVEYIFLFEKVYPSE